MPGSQSVGTSEPPVSCVQYPQQPAWRAEFSADLERDQFDLIASRAPIYFGRHFTNRPSASSRSPMHATIRNLGATHKGETRFSAPTEKGGTRPMLRSYRATKSHKRTLQTDLVKQKDRPPRLQLHLTQSCGLGSRTTAHRAAAPFNIVR
jgi:hypothetical protein